MIQISSSSTTSLVAHVLTTTEFMHNHSIEILLENGVPKKLALTKTSHYNGGLFVNSAFRILEGLSQLYLLTISRYHSFDDMF
jgi:hypothetical protein